MKRDLIALNHISKRLLASDLRIPCWGFRIPLVKDLDNNNLTALPGF